MISLESIQFGNTKDNPYGQRTYSLHRIRDHSHGSSHCTYTDLTLCIISFVSLNSINKKFSSRIIHADKYREYPIENYIKKPLSSDKLYTKTYFLILNVKSTLCSDIYTIMYVINLPWWKLKGDILRQDGWKLRMLRTPISKFKIA